MIDLYSFFFETLEQKDFDVLDMKAKPRPGFREIYEKKAERHREAEKAALKKIEGDADKPAPDLSMQKLFLSRLLSLGGSPPIISSSDPNASAVLLHALQAERCGSRRLFSQESDRYSLPQFPVVRWMEI